MKTLQEIKDYVAKKNGYSKWDMFIVECAYAKGPDQLDGGYWYRLDYDSEWPPKDANVCSEEELIDKFKNFCVEKTAQS